MLTEKRQFLKQYSEMIQAIRKFFLDRDVLEVSTPILGEHTIPDPAIESFQLTDGDCKYYLQTSPEFYMKRLLAQGSGCIYQIGKVFRREEIGRLHQPEFTMLEWYREGFNDQQLMQEVSELMQQIAGTKPAITLTYHALFQEVLSLDIDVASNEALGKVVNEKTSATATTDWSRDALLDILFCDCIEPYLKQFIDPVFVCDFPESKAALARIVQRNNRSVAARFELYYRGIELANGFYELNDSELQRSRFVKNNRSRLNNGQDPIDLDEKFLQSLTELPECSGVALGIDRLIMLATDAESIHDVINFPLLKD